MSQKEINEDIWERVSKKLKDEIGQSAFDNWLQPLIFLGIEERIASFKPPTRFIGEWVNRNYGEKILRAFTSNGVEIDRLAFTPTVAEKPLTKKLNSERGVRKFPLSASLDPQLESDLPGSPLDKRFTFESFVVGKPNELAHAAARRVADSDSVSFNPLFLYGGVGLGKTHLMHAIAWKVRSQRKQSKILYLSAEQFMYRFVQALRFKDMHGFKQLFRSVDMLMVDDVQFIAGKESTQDEFFHTFNALIDQGKHIVISADRAPGEIDGLEERIKSRLAWGLVVDLHPTDYELRLGILQAKIESHSKYHPGVAVSDNILEFLAHRVSSNVRVLEGALTRLFAFASLVGKQIDMDMVQECLADILRVSDRKVTIEEIIRKVADHYNLRMTDLMSARRSRSVARPRQVAMFLSKMLTSKSLPEIGRRFGGRDHTTVIHAVRKIEELKFVDAQLSEEVEILRRMLEA